MFSRLFLMKDTYSLLNLFYFVNAGLKMCHTELLSFSPSFVLHFYHFSQKLHYLLKASTSMLIPTQSIGIHSTFFIFFPQIWFNRFFNILHLCRWSNKGFYDPLLNFMSLFLDLYIWVFRFYWSNIQSFLKDNLSFRTVFACCSKSEKYTTPMVFLPPRPPSGKVPRRC